VPLETVFRVDATLPPLPETRNTALLHTVASSDVASLSRLVAHYNYGNVLSSVDVNGSTPVHIAVRNNDMQMLNKLLSFDKLNLNSLEAKCVGGHTALHHACLGNSKIMITALLEHGANPNIKSDSTMGETPLQICCKLGLVESARILLKHGAQTELKDNFGNNATFWAYNSHQFVLIKELGLPPSKTPSPKDFLVLLQRRIPNFVLPSLKLKSKGKGKSANDKKKKK